MPGSAATGPGAFERPAPSSVAFDAEIYSYSRTQGLFAGVSLEGNAILISKKANRRFYDDDSASRILASKAAPPAPAPALVAEITKLTVSADQAVAQEQAAKPPAATQPATEAKTYPLPDPEPAKWIV